MLKGHLGVEVERFVEEFAPLERVTEDGELLVVSSGQDKYGREVPDSVPMEVPIGYTHPPTLSDMIRRMVHHTELQRAAAAEGFDTFEEGEDFDIPDDPLDPLTPYEAVFEAPVGAVPPEASSAPVPAAAAPAEAKPEPGVASPPASAPPAPVHST